MTHKVKPDMGNGVFSDESAQNGKIMSELAKAKIRFRHPNDDLEAIARHTREPKGGDPVTGQDKHWNLSTLVFTVDNEGDVIGYTCARD